MKMEENVTQRLLDGPDRAPRAAQLPPQSSGASRPTAEDLLPD
jgi:hypothetical protein